MQQSVRYEISCDPNQHYFCVRMQLSNVAAPLRLRLPAWLPGSYMIRDFAKHIVAFSAVGTSGALDYIRPDKNTWEIRHPDEQVTIEYKVYAFDLSVRTAWLNDEFGFFNPSAVCLECLNWEGPLEVDLILPPDRDWLISTGLARVTRLTPQQQRFCADNYASLIDHPFLIGQLDVIPFQVNNIEHELVLAGRHYADREQLAKDLTAICQSQIDFFQGHVPFQHYKFLTMVVGDGFGGLEHRNSTALLTSRHSLEAPKGAAAQASAANDYFTFLSLCSHEYFHSWNVKQLRPRRFHPYHLQSEQYTEQLWFYEGVTSYLDDFFVHQAGIMTAEQFLNRTSETLTRALRGLGPLRQSLTESSQTTWTTFYQQNENSQNAIVSYYTKGAVIALLADLAIRTISVDRHSLADVMNYLYHRHAATGTSPKDLIAGFEKFTNTDFAATLQHWLQAKQPPELTEWFSAFGIQVEPATADPLTLQPQTSQREPRLPVSFGAVMQEQGGRYEVARIFEGSAAAQAGLSVKDRLVAIDGLEAKSTNVQYAMRRASPGDSVRLHVFTHDRLRELTLVWQAPPADGYKLTLQDKSLAKRWLKLD